MILIINIVRKDIGYIVVFDILYSVMIFYNS